MERAIDGRVYDLSGPEGLTHAEIAEALTRTFGMTIRHVRLTDEAYRDRLRGLGFPAEDAAAFADAYRYARGGAAGDVTSHVADLTGRPPIPFAQFCRDHAPALRGRAIGARES